MTRYCPSHRTELDGGPLTYRCRHGHTVPASDALTEPPTERPQL